MCADGFQLEYIGTPFGAFFYGNILVPYPLTPLVGCL